MQKLISIVFRANFGFFRKPDTNNAAVNLSFNMLHKPALLGILGAIVGLEGYTELGKLPEYYQKLEELKIGIEPIGHEKGNFQKKLIKYSNTIGYANKGATFLTTEATLIKPAYRCYLLLDFSNELQEKLYCYLKEGKAEYLPYFGKNEFAAWWEFENEGFKEYDYQLGVNATEELSIKTLFQKASKTAQEQKVAPLFDLFSLEEEEAAPFMYFERLPIGFDRVLNQYELADFVFSSFKIDPHTDLENLYYLKSENAYVQLF